MVPVVVVGNGAAVAVVVCGAQFHLFAEDVRGGELFGSLAECLVALGAVDAVEADFFRIAVVQDGDGVPSVTLITLAVN